MSLSVGVAKPGTTLTAYGSSPSTTKLAVSQPTSSGTLSVGTSSAGYGTNTYSPQTASSIPGTGTYNPQTTAPIPNYYGGSYGTTSSGYAGDGGGGGGALTADQQAAQAAADLASQRAAQANALKSSISGIIGNIKGVYDAIYGDVNNVAADRTSQADKAHAADVQSLTGQFNNVFPAIGSGYAARGVYDSSYRGDAEKTATDAFGNEVGQLDQGYKSDLAGIGQFVAGKQADINSQKGGLDAILAQIAESQNPDELTTLKNTLDERLRALSASRADLGTQASYLQQLNSAVPVQNRLAPLQQTLTNVVNSAIPAPVKKAIAAQVVQQSGLADGDTKKLLDQVNSQIDSSQGVA